MADTFVKNPKLIVGTQAQVEAEMGANDIGIATDVEFYTAKQIDELLEKIGGASLPILMHIWSDHVINNISWLRANTFSWHSGDVYVAAYNHLVDDINGKTTQSETIDGTTIEFIVADDGHKICLPDQEANIIYVYNRTGYANYYILDTENKQFKLPRKQKRKLVLSFKEDNAQNVWYKLYSDGWVEQGGFFADNFGGSYAFDFPITMADTNYTLTTGAGCPDVGGMHGKDYIASRTTSGFVYANGSLSNNFVNNNFSWQVSGYANPALVPSSLLELEYYYVGNFEQTAIEQTAGINTELFNAKADRNLMNTTDNVDFVVESQLPTESNGYTWYRKYKSGWVEQGGYVYSTTDGEVTVTLPVEMANTKYLISVTPNYTSSTQTATNSGAARTAGAWVYESQRTTSFGFQKQGGQWYSYWQVSGMAA